ncbi:MAG: DUF4912 domain-containing protein [Spirochaetaceae bacterium]|jgi:hypothetical protein|nr:DUF4912 domain-containing protein [Spirochaetaceae bacterium]
MDECHVTRRYLESLTTQELTVLADTAGIDIPPGLDRLFIIEEILEAKHDDESGSTLREESLVEEAEFLDPAPLPERYNITYIKTLIRDPLWVFAFWEIKSHDKEFYEKIQNFDGYFLKVVPAAGERSGHIPPPEDAKSAPSRKQAVSGLSFTVPVGKEDTAWYLGFPPDYSGKDAAGGGWFRVELVARWGMEHAVLAVSCPFRLPSLLLPETAKPPRSLLADLSAMDELQVLRNGDRRSRLPRRR